MPVNPDVRFLCLLGGYLEVKRKDRYQKRVKEQIQDILKQIEKANEEEQAEYGERDPEEMGGYGTPDIVGQPLKKKIEELNQRLRDKEDWGAKRPWTKPAYNIQLGTEGSSLLGVTVHNQSSDTPCCLPPMDSMWAGREHLPKKFDIRY